VRSVKFVAIFIVVFIIILGFLTTFKKPSGEKAPDFTITTFEGKKMTLSKLKDKPVVINIWASWCGPCQDEAPELQAFWKSYKDKVYMIGVNYKDSKKDAKSFIKKFKITYPNGTDVDGRIYKKYRATGVPETIIVNDNRIYKHIVGVTTAAELGKIIDSI